VTTSSVKDLGINTDASKANVALDKLPDMQKLLKDQQAMSAAAGTVVATAKQVSAAFTNDARKAEEAAQKTLKNVDSTPEQIAEANRTIDESRRIQAEWGVGGEKSRALNVVTGILVGGVAGQGGTQIAANAAAPYIASEIGDYFKTKGNENQTLQDLSHAVLGAALAVANNSSAAGGALAGGGGELAAQILTKELYPQAFDANGNLQRDKLTPEQANNVIALSSAIGALLSGAAGGSMHDAAIGGQVATNAVENNALDARQGAAMMKEIQKCKRNGCSQAAYFAIRDKYMAISNTNEEAEYISKLFSGSGSEKSSGEVAARVRKLLPADTFTPLPIFDPLPTGPFRAVADNSNLFRTGRVELNEVQKFLADVPKVPLNVAVGAVEGGGNLATGALPGYPDYVPFMNKARIPYLSEYSDYTEFAAGLGIAARASMARSSPGLPRSNSTRAPLPDSKLGESTIDSSAAFREFEESLHGPHPLEVIDVKPKVTAKGSVGGVDFEDVNQTAKVDVVDKPTLIAERIAEKEAAKGKALPNGTVANAHAEIGVIQRAFDAGKTKGQDMTMNVTGLDVCGYCKGDIAAAAQAAELKSLTVFAIDNVTGEPKTYYWRPGMKSIKEKE